MRILVFIVGIFFCTSGCRVSFMDIDIDYTQTKSFSVEQFDNKAGEAPATVGQLFSEQLKNDIINKTNLKYLDSNGDITFSGYVSAYELTSLAPKADETTALQRLTVRVTVDFINTKLPEDADNRTWNQTFSRFSDFSSDVNLFDVQDALIEEIFEEILQDVFNKAFTGW